MLELQRHTTLLTAQPLDPRYTFASFIVGPSNGFAHSAAVAVTQRPGNCYNPLYIYSPIGLGKTHLLHAIGHQLAATGHIVAHLSREVRGAAEFFWNRCRLADVLLVDDIQFAAGRKVVEDDLCDLLSDFCLRGKQVVATGDTHAQKTGLDDRITSRLAGGLVVDIVAPDYNNKITILRAKADQLGVIIAHPILDLMARTFNDVRTLEGCLNRLVAHAHLTKSPITLVLATRFIETAGAVIRRRPPSPEIVVQVVAEHFGMDTTVILGRRRDKYTALARKVAMYLLREESGLSSTRVGLVLDKDHSTVLYAQKALELQIDHDDAMRREIATLRDDIRFAAVAKT